MINLRYGIGKQLVFMSETAIPVDIGPGPPQQFPKLKCVEQIGELNVAGAISHLILPPSSFEYREGEGKDEDSGGFESGSDSYSE